MTGTRETREVFYVKGGGSLRVPAGTSAQRSIMFPEPGYIRYNTTSDFLEVYDGAVWKPVNASAGAIFVSGPYVVRTGDSMAGRLGIVRGNNFFPGLFFVGETDTGFFQTLSGTIGMTTEGSIAMTVASDYVETLGSLGVRTYPLSAPLTVQAYVSSRFVAEFFSTSVSGAKILMRDGTTRWVYGTKDGEWFIEDTRGYRNFIVKQSGYAVIRSDSSSQKLNLDHFASAGVSSSRKRASIGFRNNGTILWDLGKAGNSNNFFLRNVNTGEDLWTVDVSSNEMTYASAVNTVTFLCDVEHQKFVRYGVKSSSYSIPGTYDMDTSFLIITSAVGGVNIRLPVNAKKGTYCAIANMTSTNINAVTEGKIIIPGGNSARTVPTFRTGRFILVTSSWYDISI